MTDPKASAPRRTGRVGTRERTHVGTDADEVDRLLDAARDEDGELARLMRDDAGTLAHLLAEDEAELSRLLQADEGEHEPGTPRRSRRRR